jgi:hypothetical protein
MAKKRRRRIHSVRDLVADMADDVKVLVKHEFDIKPRSEDETSAPAAKKRDDRSRQSERRSEELDELREMIHALTVKVTALSADK